MAAGLSWWSAKSFCVTPRIDRLNDAGHWVRQHHGRHGLGDVTGRDCAQIGKIVAGHSRQSDANILGILRALLRGHDNFLSPTVDVVAAGACCAWPDALPHITVASTNAVDLSGTHSDASSRFVVFMVLP